MLNFFCVWKIQNINLTNVFLEDVPVKLEKCFKDHNIGDVESPPINISQATQVHKDNRAQSFGEDNSTSGLLLTIS